MDKELLARIDRLESLDEIRQLPAKYALSLDMRDMDAHVNLFAADIRVSRDKVGLDLFWLRDESLEDSASLPDPHILAQEIADDLQSALEQIQDILGDLEARAAKAGAGGSSGSPGQGAG